MKTIKIVKCGCCGCYHPATFFGDCRDDLRRYSSPEDAQERNNGAQVVEVFDDGSESVLLDAT